MQKRILFSLSKRTAASDPPGIVLILTVLLVGLLLVMGMTMLNLASSDYQIANNESRSIQALYNADAGTDEAKMRLSPNAPSAAAIPIGTATNWRAYILSGRTQAEIQGGLDPTYAWTPPNYTTAEATTNYVFYNTIQTGSNTIPWGWARIQHKVDGAGNVIYQDALTGSDTTSASQTVGALSVNNPPIVVVTTEGIQGNVRRMLSVEYQPIVAPTTTTTTVVTDPFGHAAHGKGVVDLGGNGSTDSYNSDNGTYNVGGNRFQRGHISSDGTTGGTIDVGSNATVNGDVYAGPGAAAGAIQNSGTITGTQGTETSTWTLPLSAIPSGVSNLGNLSLSGNPHGDCSYTLSEGTYWFSSISITGNAKLCVSGAVKIYVTGSVDIGGNGVATANNKPPNFLLYGTVDPNNSANKCTSVSFTGNSAFYGAVYAPDADIAVVGNGAIYGALTGKTVSFTGNADLHYDEALGNLGRFVTTATSTTYTTTGFRRYSWREIPF
ncbi:MAG: hypothetical protein HY712_05950 [candidate division NC10 bacterium]|nr:hypothetical protein [candidate division NC10 bacterium]